MEVRTRPVPPTALELDAIIGVLGADDRWVDDRTMVGGHHNRKRRWLLLPTLHAVNDRVGWVSGPAIDEIARRLDLGPAEVYGVASFYGLFAFSERPRRQIHVCTDLVCRAAAPDIAAGLPAGTHPSPCLGMCEQAPVALVIDSGDPAQHRMAECISAADIQALVDGAEPAPEAPPSDKVHIDEHSILLRRVGRGDPLDLDAFIDDGGFGALRRARAMTPADIIDAVDAAGLVGRGGAGFPTSVKWRAVLDQAASPHYLVCNADESEPGTFKDRALIENDPFRLVEAIAIAMLATGCEQAYVYLRGEYPRAWETMHEALDRIEQRPGVAALLSGLTITPFKGAGAYICGEETAIFNSIEGYRGEPRNKPPYPFEVGLFGKPTAVNNVETLMNVPPIIDGIDAGGYRANRRLLCLSGAIERPGVYEIELGRTLGEVIELAGGLRSGSRLRAVLLGGAAGGFVGPSDLGLVLDHDAVRAAGLTLGSGVVMVLDDRVDLVDQLTRIATFFRDESCGQCVPCRVGTVRQEEALGLLATGATPADLDLLRDVGRAMTDASICGLGQTAFNAIESALVRLDPFGSQLDGEVK